MLPTYEKDNKHAATGEAHEPEAQHEMFLRAPAPGRRRPLFTAFGVVAICYLFWTLFTTSAGSFHRFCGGMGGSLVPSQEVEVKKALVPLEAHIMSKCPDATACMQLLVLPAMQQVIDKVNFTLSYIGTPTDNDGVECMHGPGECMGNIIQLCAANLYPDPKQYLGFDYCLMRDYKSIPQKSLIEDCALEHQLDFEKLNECAIRDDGGFGMGMLRDSIRHTRDVNVTKSCTVRLNEEIYCIRDGGEWKDCPHGAGVNDLVITVEKLYRSS